MTAGAETSEGTKPRLVGVGVGPGEAALITLKALDVLSAADVILVPATEATADKAGRAEQIVLENRPELADRIRRIPFSMADRAGVTTRRKESWEASADAAIEAFTGGATCVCFATIGDPSVYSTFSYLAGTVLNTLDVAIEVIPGITAMQAIAAATTTPLVEGTEVLALVPATAGDDVLADVLNVVDTIVAYKGGRTLPNVLATIEATGERDTHIGTNIGLPNQRLLTPADLAEGETTPYFSTVLSAPKRNVTGGRL